MNERYTHRGLSADHVSTDRVTSVTQCRISQIPFKRKAVAEEEKVLNHLNLRKDNGCFNIG